MVRLVRQGKSQREIARRFGVSLHTVQRWVDRAGDIPLEAVDWKSRPHIPRTVVNKTAAKIEREICAIRKKLESESALGFSGALSIHEALHGSIPVELVPSVRTIGRILQRNGFMDRRHRVRNQAPPAGWYLPGLAQGALDVDCFDVVEDLRMDSFGLFQVFTARALWAPIAEAWPAAVASTTFILEALQAHWQQNGLPQFAQFDNDVRFQGGHNHPDVIGRVMRLCLGLGVTPVFAPPLEMGFQGVIENFNGLWQKKVWNRFHHESIAALIKVSQRFTGAYRQHLARSHDQRPLRRPFPKNFVIDWQKPPSGLLIYLRRANEQGVVKLLGHSYEVDSLWQHRLVRCELDLDRNEIRFYRLRRREPSNQPLIKTVSYHFPHRKFDTRSRHQHPVTPIP
jgi:putative transposase